MAMTLNAEDIAAILAAVEGSLVLPMKTDVTPLALEASLAPLALEASLAPLALDATVAKEASLAPLALDSTVAKEASLAPLALDATVAKEASLAPLALEASLAPLALEASIADLPTAAENAGAVWDELAADHETALTTGYRLGAAATSNPSAETIADVVLDELAVDHVVSGSFGAAIGAFQAGAYPAPSVIAAAVWSKIVTGAIAAETALAALYNGWTADVGAGSGAGAIVTTITITVGGVPVDGAEVWVTLASDDSVVIAGTLVTDVNGEVVFMLDAATYHLWRQKAGVNFTNPETIVVTA